MAGFIKIGFFLFLVFLQEAGAHSTCGKVFVSHKKIYLKNEPKNPLTINLLEGYKMLREPFKIGKKKQWRELEKGLANDFIEFLEKTPTEQEQKRLQFLSVRFMETGITKIPEIMEFVSELSEEKAVLFQPVAEAVFAVFGKYVPAALKSKDYEKNDWERINFILKSIAEFNRNDAEFSLFKIKRAIKGRYSFREFILCRRG